MRTPRRRRRAPRRPTSPNPAVVCARARACVVEPGEEGTRGGAASDGGERVARGGPLRGMLSKQRREEGAHRRRRGVGEGDARPREGAARPREGAAGRGVGRGDARVGETRGSGKREGARARAGWGSGCVTDRGESGRSARLEGWRVVGGGGRIAGERRAHAVDRGRTYPSARRRLRSARTSRVSARRDARGEPRALTRAKHREQSRARRKGSDPARAGAAASRAPSTLGARRRASASVVRGVRARRAVTCEAERPRPAARVFVTATFRDDRWRHRAARQRCEIRRSRRCD